MGDCRLLGKPTRSGAPLGTFLCVAIFLEHLLNTRAGTRCCGSREKRSPPPQGNPPSGELQRLFPANLYSNIYPQRREHWGQSGTWVKTPPLPQSTWNEQDSTVTMIIKGIKGRHFGLGVMLLCPSPSTLETARYLHKISAYSYGILSDL